MAPAKSSFNSQRGFSLIEVIISMGLLTTVSLGVAQLFAVSTKANRTARNQTSAVSLAEQKIEQIRSLSWGFDLNGLGLPVTDTTTDLSVYPHGNSGSGLNPSPSDSLLVSRDGFVDYLDTNGVWVGTGATPPGNAAYIRRWSILPLPTNPNNTLVIQVLVTAVSDETQRVETTGRTTRPRMPGDVMLISVKTRKAQ
jgi:prepilin-type N-terminal cleavage/methylation domain-containing protein